ncbi:hypothetical protein WJX72_009318 [[Myrmecia] bisecta]|uniref:Uncharacterized protein n=1 Tax=[Myrmecia] bisecta TaxID=41462 RepID=A0AAW1PH12_9CHLO
MYIKGNSTIRPAARLDPVKAPKPLRRMRACRPGSSHSMHSMPSPRLRRPMEAVSGRKFGPEQPDELVDQEELQAQALVQETRRLRLGRRPAPVAPEAALEEEAAEATGAAAAAAAADADQDGGARWTCTREKWANCKGIKEFGTLKAEHFRNLNRGPRGQEYHRTCKPCRDYQKKYKDNKKAEGIGTGLQFCSQCVQNKTPAEFDGVHAHCMECTASKEGARMRRWRKANYNAPDGRPFAKGWPEARELVWAEFRKSVNEKQKLGQDVQLCEEDKEELLDNAFAICIWCAEARHPDDLGYRNDRIITSGHYRAKNCLPCCWACNRARGTWTVPDAVQHNVLRRVTRHRPDGLAALQQALTAREHGDLLAGVV